MIKVIVAERSEPLLARLLSVLRLDTAFQLIGTAKTCHQLLSLSKRFKPDLIILGMSIQAGHKNEDPAKEIMIECPTPIVVVIGQDDGQQADASIRALHSGALAVVEPPPLAEDEAYDDSSRQFLAALRAMAQVKVVRRWRERRRQDPAVQPTTAAGVMPKRLSTSQPMRLVTIAASTGGPVALQSILSALPRDFPVPILVVQHIATGFIHGVATWLATTCSLDVRVPVNREITKPGTVYLAPDHHHMGISSGGAIILSNEPPIEGFRPSANYLFQAAGHAWGAGVVAVILTGMGRDGVNGLRALRDEGGHVIAQDEGSCVVFGMPKAAIEAGVVDHVLSLSEISGALISMVKAA